MTTPTAPTACPICGKPAADKYRPFCSRRCADVDLHRWLGGVYRIESDQPADAPDQQPPGEE
jgi:endogenous inhibitor of DNA gyrase (YacG/DUF329 family)